MPPPQLNEAELKRLWESAQRLETGDDPQGAAVSYAAMLRVYVEAGAPPKPYVQMRMVKNLCRLERFSPALKLLQELRQRLVAANDAHGTFLVDLQRCEVWLLSANRFRAARILSRAGDTHGPLGRVAPGQLPRLEERLRELSWPLLTAQETAQARVEARLMLSRLWASSGHFEPAVEMLQRAVADAEWRELGLRRMDLLLLAAEHYLDQGELATAEQLITSRLEPTKEASTADSSDVFRWTLLRARVASLRGRFGEARRLTEELLQPGRRASPKERLHARWWLAQTLLSLNRTLEVEALIQQALAQLPPGGTGRIWAARFEALQVQLLRRRRAMGEELIRPFAPEEAGALRFVSPELWEEYEAEAPAATGAASPPRPRRTRERFAEDWARLANRLLASLEDEQPEVTRQSLEALTRLAARTDSKRLSARTGFYRGIVAYYRGSYKEAKELLTQAVDAARLQGLVFDVWQTLGFLAWACARLQQPEEYASHAAQAKLLLDAMVASLDARDRVFFRLNKWSAQDEYLAALARALPRPSLEGLGPIASWRARRGSQRARLKLYRVLSCLTGWDIHQHLEQSAPEEEARAPGQASTTLQVEEWVRKHMELGAGGSRPRAGLDASPWLLWRIPRSVAVVHFYVLADRVLAFVLRHRHIELHTLPLSREQLWRRALEALDEISLQARSRSGEHEAVDQSLRGLSTALGLEQLLGALPAHVERLAIIPHDVIVNLPFPALFLGEQRLCERFACSLLPDIGVLSPRAHRKARPLKARCFLGVGVSSYEGTGLKSLPGAADEPEALASLTRSAQRVYLKDGEAQASHVMRALEQAEWAHLACHGEFQPEAPHRSCLYLSAEGPGASSLSVVEISRLRLGRLRLAVLASCWSSSAAVLPGSELICIPAAFLRAGAGAVVASLWQVNNAAVLPFMKQAYEEIALHGVTEGLARAQRHWCRQSPSAAGAVHLWGGYLAYGNG